MSRWPGILIVAALSVAAWAIAHATTTWGIGTAAIGILLGWMVGRGRLPAPYTPGVGWLAKAALLFAVTLLGFTVDVQTLLGAGSRVLLLALAAIVISMTAAQWLGKLLGVSAPLRTLIGVGTGVCGVSAMAACKEAAGANERDLSLGATMITLLGSIGLLGLPAWQWATHALSPTAFGAWAGASLQAVPHAIGAGFAGGGAVGAEWASMVKLTRVAMLAGVVVYVASRRGGATSTKTPLEVKLFLGALVLGNLHIWPVGARDVVGVGASWSLIIALVALALQTRTGDLKAAGRGAWFAAIGTWAAVLVGTGLIVAFW